MEAEGQPYHRVSNALYCAVLQGVEFKGRFFPSTSVQFLGPAVRGHTLLKAKSAIQETPDIYNTSGSGYVI